jgi:stearoyl-CoA desaturase (delta-9 desaturase)
MFQLSPFWEKTFYFLTFISQGPSFLNPKSYAILHRNHHQFSDTKLDPHSPHYSKNIWRMMLKTFYQYQKILKNTELKESKTLNCPQWHRLDVFAQSYYNLILWTIVYILIYNYFDIDLIYYIFLPLHFILGPIQGSIVNWFGHKIGYQNFLLNDKSKNSIPIDFVLMGELYQNNHHKYGNKLNFAYKWFEIDFTYQITKILIFFKIVKFKRPI